MKLLIPILFAIGTALAWGSYGPTIAKARSPVGEWTAFKPYVFIGVAYLVWAVVGGLIGMSIKGDNYSYGGPQSTAAVWGFAAGSLGAIGALCLTSAMLTGGRPLFVMPIVFGGAVSVTALIEVVRLRDLSRVSPMLWVGMVLAVIGIVLVAANTPHAHPKVSPPGAASNGAATDGDSSQG